MQPAGFRIEEGGDRPLVAAALHDGHELRAEVAAAIALPEAERLREEDPFTARWTELADNRVVGLRSRFEVDLNRPRDAAVYRTPGDAWGLDVWQDELAPDVAARSLAVYDAFYDAVGKLLDRMRRRFGRFVVYDLHTYNHRRDGPDGPVADPAANPEVNVGTGTMDRARWSPVVDRFLTDLSALDFQGRRLDVRENVRFRGGWFPNWTHRNYPSTACVLAIEFKKFFMDEWTGNPDPLALEAIDAALESTVPGVLEALHAL